MKKSKTTLLNWERNTDAEKCKIMKIVILSMSSFFRLYTRFYPMKVSWDYKDEKLLGFYIISVKVLECKCKVGLRLPFASGMFKKTVP